MKRKGYIKLVTLVLLVQLAILGCSNKVENVSKVNALPEIYPDYIGVTIPAGIAP